MAILPYRLRLRKVSRRQQQLLSALRAYLPDTALRDRFVRGVRQAVAAVVGDPFEMRLEGVEQEPFSFFLRRLPASPALIVISLMPGKGHIVCEVDTTLAMMAVERLLGGQLDAMPEPRALTDIEQGVLQYLVLEILAGAHQACGSEPRVHFRFERFAAGAEEASAFAEPDAPVAVLAWRVTLGRYSGFVRLCFTEPFLDQALLDLQARGEERPLESGEAREMLAQYGFLRVPIWAEAGRTTLYPADLKGLEEGDVVLLEQGDIALSGNASGGRAVLRVGSGLNSGLDAEVAFEGDRARLSIIGLHKGV